MIRILHHDDPDGIVSAAIIAKLLKVSESTLRFYEMNYNKIIPIDDIEKDDVVFIVDFSVGPEVMKAILDITSKVFWIDHHISAINKYAGFSYESMLNDVYIDETYIEGLRKDGVAGCQLTWEYLMQFNNSTLPETDIEVCWEDDAGSDKLVEGELPILIDYVADYDVFTLAKGDETKQFIAAFNCLNSNPWFWINSLNDKKLVFRLVLEGDAMLRYQRSLSEMCEPIATKVYIDGTAGIALNIPFRSSTWYDGIHKDDDIEFLLTYFYDGNKWNYSIYHSNEESTFDCQAFATQYDGGGHKGAAGFIHDHLIVNLLTATTP